MPGEPFSSSLLPTSSLLSFKQLSDLGLPTPLLQEKTYFCLQKAFLCLFENSQAFCFSYLHVLLLRDSQSYSNLKYVPCSSIPSISGAPTMCQFLFLDAGATSVYKTDRGLILRPLVNVLIWLVYDVNPSSSVYLAVSLLKNFIVGLLNICDY